MGKEDFTKIPHGVSGVQDRMSVVWERGVVGVLGALSAWVPGRVFMLRILPRILPRRGGSTTAPVSLRNKTNTGVWLIGRDCA
jgi:hypothetical protein